MFHLRRHIRADDSLETDLCVRERWRASGVKALVEGASDARRAVECAVRQTNE